MHFNRNINTTLIALLVANFLSIFVLIFKDLSARQDNQPTNQPRVFNINKIEIFDLLFHVLNVAVNIYNHVLHDRPSQTKPRQINIFFLFRFYYYQFQVEVLKL